MNNFPFVILKNLRPSESDISFLKDKDISSAYYNPMSVMLKFMENARIGITPYTFVPNDSSKQFFSNYDFRLNKSSYMKLLFMDFHLEKYTGFVNSPKYPIDWETYCSWMAMVKKGKETDLRKLMLTYNGDAPYNKYLDVSHLAFFVYVYSYTAYGLIK